MLPLLTGEHELELPALGPAGHLIGRDGHREQALGGRMGGKLASR